MMMRSLLLRALVARNHVVETWGLLWMSYLNLIVIKSANPAKWFAKKASFTTMEQATHAGQRAALTSQTLLADSAFTPRSVRSSMSSQYPHSAPSSGHLFEMQAARSRAHGRKLHHKRFVMRIAADLSFATTAVCGVLAS